MKPSTSRAASPLELAVPGRMRVVAGRPSTVGEIGLEHVLQVREPGIAEGLREPHQRRRLDASLAGHTGHGAQRHRGRMLPEVDRDLAKLLGEPGGSGGQNRAKLFITAGPRVAERRADVCSRHLGGCAGLFEGPVASHR